jgi:hypothetical protein
MKFQMLKTKFQTNSNFLILKHLKLFGAWNLELGICLKTKGLPIAETKKEGAAIAAPSMAIECLPVIIPCVF